MSLTKHATFKVLAARIATEGGPLMRTAHRAEFNYTPKPGFLYVRSRAISSRCNDNFDEFPAEEIKTAYRSFIGKPVFVNHHNADHRRARGVIIDAALHEDRNPDGSPDTWVEVLMEVDAIRFPKLAMAIVKGHIGRTSMGTDVAYSICSVCGNKAATPLDYCRHIPRMKGQRIYRTTASGTKEGVLVREICYGLGFFENSLLVEEPADPTAYLLDRPVLGAGVAEALGVTASRKISAEQRTTPLPAALFGVDDDRKAANESRAQDAGLEPCTTCGRGVKPGSGSIVTVVDGGSSILHPDETPDFSDPGYMGSWVLGPECAKKVPSEFRSKWGGWTASRRTTAKEDKAISPSETQDPARYKGVSIKQDEKGYYVHTHRARSDSYPSPEEIPDKDIEFIESTGSRKTAAKTALMPGEVDQPVIAPAQVNTLRDEKCPVCGEEDSFDGEECQVCGFIAPPDEFGDPDVEKAKQVDLRQDTDDAAGVAGGALRCDSCGATFADADAAPAKTALVLDKDRAANADDQKVDVQGKAGDTCPTCGKGTLQVVSPAADGKGSGNFAPAGSAPKTIDQDKFAPAGSAAKQGSKAPRAARRVGSQKEESMRPALAALAAQQEQIKTLLGENDSLKKAVAFIATAAGVESHPVITAALRPRVAVDVQESPGSPAGWAIDPKGTEAPAVSSGEAAAPTAKDDPTSIGGSPLTDVAPAAVTSPTAIQTVLDVPLDLNEQDPTQPVAGTDGEGAGQPGTNTDEVDVRVGDPNKPEKAFDDGGFLSTGSRMVAALRLARLQIQAGLVSGDDLVLSQQIAASKDSDETLQTKIDTLASVVNARPAAAPAPRRLVPQAASTTAARVNPLTAVASAPVPAIVGSVSDDEMAFE